MEKNICRLALQKPRIPPPRRFTRDDSQGRLGLRLILRVFLGRGAARCTASGSVTDAIVTTIAGLQRITALRFVLRAAGKR
jgi:hypothetical protein